MIGMVSSGVRAEEWGTHHIVLMGLDSHDSVVCLAFYFVPEVHFWKNLSLCEGRGNVLQREHCE